MVRGTNIVGSALRNDETLSALAEALRFRRGETTGHPLVWPRGVSRGGTGLAPPTAPSRGCLRPSGPVSVEKSCGCVTFLGTYGRWRSRLEAIPVPSDDEPQNPLESAWTEKTNWLLEHGSVLLVRKTGARALEAFLSRAVKAVPGAATASKLSDIADVVRGSHVPREELTEAKGATGPPYIRVGDIQPDGPRPPARALRAASAEARTLQPDDVLVTLSGSVGRVARVPDTWADAVPSANLAVISPLPGVRPEYLASLLATAPYQTWLEGHATGATVQHLRLGELRDLPILVLEEDRQRTLEESLRAGDSAERVLASLSGSAEDYYARLIATERRFDDLRHLDLSDPEWKLAVYEAAHDLWILTHLVTDVPSATGGTRSVTLEQDGPFAEWLAAVHRPLGHVHRSLETHRGSDLVVALSAAEDHARKSAARLRAAVSERPTRYESDAIRTADGVADAIGRFSAKAREALLTPAEAPFNVRLEPDSVEAGRPTDLLLIGHESDGGSAHSGMGGVLAPRHATGRDRRGPHRGVHRRLARSRR